MTSQRPIMVMAALLGGPIVTGLLFTVLYATTTLACLHPHEAAAFDFRFVSLSLAAVTIAGLVYFVFWTARTIASPFLKAASSGLGIIGLMGALWLTFPLLLIADCRA